MFTRRSFIGLAFSIPRRVAVVLGLAVGMFLFASGSSALAVRGDDVPEGLSASDWSSVRAAYVAHRYAAFAVEGSYEARNAGQRWRTRFDGRGFVITSD